MRKALSVLPALVVSASLGGTLSVVRVEPEARTGGASVQTPIVVEFDRPVDRTSVTPNSFWAFGRWSGAADGSFTFSNGDRIVTLTPSRQLSAGESVMVILSHDLEGADGSPFRDAGYSYQFATRAQPAAMGFTEIDRLTVRTIPSQPTQAYGGIGSDLDGDGFLDVTIVNEITEDLRVFMNKADSTGEVHPFIQPPFPVGDRASPSEPSDFNRDGLVDICVANIDDDNVSILLGNGDGTYAPQQLVAVGNAPRGIAVLDADGDGDVDIVNTNAQSSINNMTLLLNDGNGVFGPPTFFAAGGAGAWGLAAADMTNDGILDLVIGAQFAQRIFVPRGNGDGTFTQTSVQSAGGQNWMLNCGDVNGDGAEDVASINSHDDNGAILLGDGNGNLGSPQVYTTDPFALATDLGDVDGDGDLDWMTSSFFGDWRLYLNDGAGGFTFDQEFDATSAASCSLMLDLDNDGDLDLALIDEIADELVLMKNSGFAVPAPPPGVIDLTVGKLDPEGPALALSWDTATCDDDAGHQIVFGGGAQLPVSPGGGFAIGGSRCGVGTNQPFGWLNAPDAIDSSDLIWFLVLATDGASTEGSWGKDAAGAERVGPGAGGASEACGVTLKDLSNACGH